MDPGVVDVEGAGEREGRGAEWEHNTCDNLCPSHVLDKTEKKKKRKVEGSPAGWPSGREQARGPMGFMWVKERNASR